MRSLVYSGPREVSVIDSPAPRLRRPRDVVLEVEVCGVCGSDLASYAHGHYVRPGEVMGHEAAARVVSAGEAHTELPPGTRVAVRPMRTCGVCAYCVTGDAHLCEASYGPSLGYGTPGAFAERVLVSDAVVGTDLYPVPGETDPLDLLWAEPVAVAVHAMRRFGPSPPHRLLVVGGGPVGLTVAAVALAEGSVVDLVEPVAGRRSAAEGLGARAYDVGALPESARYDGMVDGSGNAAAIATAERLLAPGAKAVLVGLGDETPRIRPGGAPLLGSFGYRDDEFARAVELIAGGRVRLGSIVTHIFPLERADQALDSRRWDPTVVKAAIVPQKEQK